MLQVVDEMDDVFGAVQQRWLGLHTEIGFWLTGGTLLAAASASLLVGVGVAS